MIIDVSLLVKEPRCSVNDSNRLYRNLVGYSVVSDPNEPDPKISIVASTDSNFSHHFAKSPLWIPLVEFCNQQSLREGLTPAFLVSGDSVTIDMASNGYRVRVNNAEDWISDIDTCEWEWHEDESNGIQ